MSAANVPNPISWADEERDLSAWLGNEMQQEAFNKVYELRDAVSKCDDPAIIQDFNYLQVSDHFYYMSTKFFSDGEVHSYFNPYNTPYEAFINYMNVLSDFKIRVDAAVAEHRDDDVARLSKIIKEKDVRIQKFEEEIGRLKASSKAKPAAKKPAAKKPVATAKKTAKKAPTAKPGSKKS